MRTNCDNCGGTVKQHSCEYCGTSYAPIRVMGLPEPVWGKPELQKIKTSSKKPSDGDSKWGIWLIVLLAVGFIVFAGYVIYKRQKDKLKNEKFSNGGKLSEPIPG